MNPSHHTLIHRALVCTHSTDDTLSAVIVFPTHTSSQHIELYAIVFESEPKRFILLCKVTTRRFRIYTQADMHTRRWMDVYACLLRWCLSFYYFKCVCIEVVFLFYSRYRVKTAIPYVSISIAVNRLFPIRQSCFSRSHQPKNTHAEIPIGCIHVHSQSIHVYIFENANAHTSNVELRFSHLSYQKQTHRDIDVYYAVHLSTCHEHSNKKKTETAELNNIYTHARNHSTENLWRT